MSGDRVFTGYLSYLRGRPVPSWVEPPHVATNVLARVYVELYNGQGLYSLIYLLHENHNPNVRVNRVFIEMGNHTALGAFLRPYNTRSHLAGNTRIFVRMPNESNSIYSGTLERADGELPPWLFT